MSAHNRVPRLVARRPVVSGLLAGLVTSVAIGLVWVSSVETAPALVSMEGIQVLSDAQMKEIKGGWLRPKAQEPPGCDCEGCRTVMLLAVGPDTRRGFVSNEPRTLKDITPTNGELLDFETPKATGTPILEILVESD